MPRLPVSDKFLLTLLKKLPSEERAAIKLHPITPAWVEQR